MRKALTDLKRFIRANNGDEERHEIRAYVRENARELGEVFGVSSSQILAGLETEADDGTLLARLVKEIAAVERGHRDQRVEDRTSTAQASADVLGNVAVWEEDRAIVDVVSLLASTITGREDMLIFVADTFAVGIPMAHLFDLRKLGRVDLTGWVDAKGLHVRWKTGGLNFLPAMDPRAARITVPLARRERVAA
jgi:hypothetical protein